MKLNVGNTGRAQPLRPAMLSSVSKARKAIEIKDNTLQVNGRGAGLGAATARMLTASGANGVIAECTGPASVVRICLGAIGN